MYIFTLDDIFKSTKVLIDKVKFEANLQTQNEHLFLYAFASFSLCTRYNLRLTKKTEDFSK